MRIKLIQSIIDKIRQKKEYVTESDYINLQKKMEKRVKRLGIKYKKGKKIKVAFLCLFSNLIQYLTVFEEMMNSDIFDPYFIIYPDISRTEEHKVFQYNKSKNDLEKRYGKNRILDGYLIDKDKFIDYTKKFDLATTNNPYDCVTHNYFKVTYWTKKGVPMFYIPYFYMGRCYVTIDNLEMDELNYFWKIFAENNYVKHLSKKYQKLKGYNIVVSGSPKLDNLINYKKENINDKYKKKIIIALHHNIDDRETSIGSFLDFSDLLIEIVESYKDIQFIFRPHHLLRYEVEKKWGKEKTKEWFDKFLKYQNVLFSDEGDYLKWFVNSDALIHDCGSFSCEYLYTGKPCAFLVRKSTDWDKTFTNFGKDILNMHYLIKNKSDLKMFIENILLKSNDVMQQKRDTFSKKEIMINYPNSTKYIYEHIKNILQGEDM